jgi:hypothetical protein
MRDDLARALQIAARPARDNRNPDEREADELRQFEAYQKLADVALAFVQARMPRPQPSSPPLTLAAPPPWLQAARGLDFMAWAASLDDGAARCERAAAREANRDVARCWRAMAQQWTDKSAFLHAVALCISPSAAPSEGARQ